MVRAALLQKGWDAVPEIEGIMNGESSTGQPVHPSQQISAWKTMMELSLPKINETLTVTIDSERIIRALSTVFNRHFTREKSLELIKELRAEVEGK